MYLVVFLSLHKTVEFYIQHEGKFSLQSAKVLYYVSMSSIIETKNKKEFQNLSQTGNFIQLFSVGIQWLFGSLGAFQLGLFICLSDKKKLQRNHLLIYWTPLLPQSYLLVEFFLLF